jgi:hypothetical protein
MCKIEKHLKLSIEDALIMYLPKREGEGERLIEKISDLVI